MATTPPQTSRIRTPPTPLHGSAYDNYEPYSPRRSTRRTAQSNPYSSLNAERSPQRRFSHSATTPPPTAATGKRARFARAPTHLSSPPSSPASPVVRRQHASPHKTPQARGPATSHAHKAARTSTSSESDALSSSSPPQATSHSHHLTHLAPPTAMLPTPSKTPSKKRPAQPLATTAATARILTFQPNHPNDVMPSPRKLKTHPPRPQAATTGFELDDSDDVGARNGVRGARAGARAGNRSEGIEIYTDANARVPVWDESEENPFVVSEKPRGDSAARERPPRPQRRSRKTKEEVEREERMNEAVGRGEGVVYVFRGKKLFRRFDDDDNNTNLDAGDDISETPTQRRLRQQAGPAAQRPLTRSAIKPRLLFPPAAEQHREQGLDDVDEEAATDIEMGTAEPMLQGEEVKEMSSPVMEVEFAARDDEEGEHEAVGILPVDATTSPRFVRAATTKRSTKGGFESWQRTKGGIASTSVTTSGRKRAGDGGEEGGSGGGKRVRGAAAVGSLG